MSVYLEDEITENQRRAIEAALAPGPVVAAQEYVSKDAALARFKQTFTDLARSIDTLAGNPLPASYEVRLNAEGATEAGIDELGTRLRATAGVADVRYDRQWLSRLTSAIALVRGVGLLMGAVLALAAALTVAAVVRLALNARSDEIEIMQLVGAPTMFVRGPFVMEGVIQGGIGALVALVALAVVFYTLRGSYLVPLAAAVNLSTIRFLPVELGVLLVFGGMAVGCVGGLVAAWGK
jgi:cell division transport system permease protein